MTKFNNEIDKAKTWATGHIIAAVAIGAAVGFLLGLMF